MAWLEVFRLLWWLAEWLGDISLGFLAALAFLAHSHPQETAQQPPPPPPPEISAPRPPIATPDPDPPPPLPAQHRKQHKTADAEPYPVKREDLLNHRKVIKADDYNQCYVSGLIDNNIGAYEESFLIDSGASAVVLGQNQFKQLGDPASLVYDRPIWTANGAAMVANYRIHMLYVAGLFLDDVPALVVKGELQNPLLGAPVLKRLHVEVRDGSCILNVR
jgi:clan AA aspartic protease (TIGR02281 family)